MKQWPLDGQGTKPAVPVEQEHHVTVEVRTELETALLVAEDLDRAADARLEAGIDPAVERVVGLDGLGVAEPIGVAQHVLLDRGAERRDPQAILQEPLDVAGQFAGRHVVMAEKLLDLRLRLRPIGRSIALRTRGALEKRSHRGNSPIMGKSFCSCQF